MNTTGGKTALERKARPITILRVKDGGRTKIATVEAAGLRKALMHYFEETLKPQGHWDPLFQGNTMSVKNKFCLYEFYDAVDVPGIDTRGCS